VAVGTIKSRVNRARSRLAQMLAVEEGQEFEPDPTIKAALQGTLGT
jgi:RNA polymerase sigma-70 factor (ECF subfamily)